MRKKHARLKPDYWLLIIILILLTIGTLMVFSSTVIMAETRFHSPYLFVFKQFLWLSIGAGAMYFFATSDYSKLQKYSWPFIVTAGLLLVAVLLVGSERGGARRWFAWGFLSFQPSELAKIAVIMALADYLDRKKSKLTQWKGIWPPLLVVCVICGLIGLEPDLGTPVLIFSVAVAMLFIAGASMKYLFGIGILALPLIAEEILRKPYRLVRLKAFLTSWGDIKSVSYQLDQSLVALGSGGFFGKGLAKGEMKLLHIPEPHTDFIFPIIGEELGFIGAIIIIGLFFLLAWRGIQIARNCGNLFGSLLASGITLVILLQALINIGVTCGLFPTKGLPLPFVSYGGTTLVINMAEIGMLLSISKAASSRK
jgi:cell division protein FtsW